MPKSKTTNSLFFVSIFFNNLMSGTRAWQKSNRKYPIVFFVWRELRLSAAFVVLSRRFVNRAWMSSFIFLNALIPLTVSFQCNAAWLEVGFLYSVSWILASEYLSSYTFLWIVNGFWILTKPWLQSDFINRIRHPNHSEIAGP